MNWPVVILALVTLQRLGELVLARRNTAKLLAAGGYEVGAAHYPIIVVFHAAWLLGLWWLAPSQSVNWILIGIFAVLQALRIWVIATLGGRWTTRIIRVPNEVLVARGPFRFLNHPNYAVVTLEIFVLPLAFGLVAFAMISGLINICILAWRISVENAALTEARK
jgi:methyltransferase